MAGQAIAEYYGPRLRMRHLVHSTYALEVPDGSDTFIDGLFETLVGGSMTKAQIVAPFEQAFNSDDPSLGGCAEVPPCPPPCHPPMVEGAGVERGRRREPGSSLRVGLHLL